MGAVLGANVMRDHNVVFDFDNHRVGFAEGTCDYNDDLRKELNVINRVSLQRMNHVLDSANVPLSVGAHVMRKASDMPAVGEGPWVMLTS